VTIGRLSGFMDQLVSESRSTRDSAFNALDAVNRDSRRAGAELGAQVAAKVAEQKAREALQAAPAHTEPSAPEPADPNRFAPEDEWELAEPAPPASPPPSAPPVARTTSPRVADDDEDDYPATWLR
jgi:hypothetical protein